MPRRSAAVSLFLAIAVVAGPAMAAKEKDAPEKSADARDKMVCKRFLETGSLVKGHRVCKTKAEWERERENLQELNARASCGSSTGQC